MDIFDIAKVCHNLNKAYCESLGDFSQKYWSDTSAEIRESAIKGVKFILDKNLDVKPSDSHMSWYDNKVANQWSYGPVKCEINKTHPCLVPFHLLPKEQQLKDILFVETVKSLAGYLDSRKNVL